MDTVNSTDTGRPPSQSISDFLGLLLQQSGTHRRTNCTASRDEIFSVGS